MNYTVKNAQEYISKNIEKVNLKYRQKFHMMPPIGWMNDPNGLVKFNGEYHIFYQFYPYDSNWGPMHWGHFKTSDFIKYQDLPVALAPEDQSVESGCFSGGAIVKDNNLHLIYTRHYEVDGFKSESQYSAVSEDGINFIKSEHAVFDNSKLPENLATNDFRDPNPVYINGTYYLFVGGKDIKKNLGVIIILKSDDLETFEYHFHIENIYEMGDMGECPSYLKIGEYDILILSGCNVAEKNNCYLNVNSNVAVICKIDFEHKTFKQIAVKELDKGDAFYAAQTVKHEDNIMIGWLEMWGKEYLTTKLGHNWAGCLSIPRVLSLEGTTLLQNPVDTIKNYYKRQYNVVDGEYIDSVCDLSFSAKRDFKFNLKSENEELKIYGKDGYLYVDTANTNNLVIKNVRRTDEAYDEFDVRVLLDVSSVEVFVNNGREVISFRIYMNDSKYLLNSENVSNVVVNEIEV